MMATAFVLAGVLVIGILVVFAILHYIETDEFCHLFGYGIILCCFFIVWGVAARLHYQEYEYIEFNVNKVDNVDLIVCEGNTHNLNSIFKRSFPDGSKVYVKQQLPGWSLGMYFEKTYLIEQILLEKPEDLVYNNSTE